MSQLSLTGKRWTMGEDMRSAVLGTPRTQSAMLLERLRLTRGIATDGLLQSAAGLFPQLPAAVDRIRGAIARGERIAIFGDYDCDGITSAALLARYFHRRNVRPLLRLPHRSREGYGLKAAIIDELRQMDITLLITVDTGVTATKEVAMARQAGMDVIIADHHHLPPELPAAHAILHPALAPAFPEPHPSAAGVTWTLVEALEMTEGRADWPDRAADLALAAIGTVADLVELRGMNRLLVQAGLRALSSINDGPLGLLRLQAGVAAAPVTSRDVAFRIAPRLNAAGRMADPGIALRAILGDETALLRLEELNRERQAHVAALMEGLLADMPTADTAFICIASERFQPGICGLLAGKLCEKFGRPALVACIQEEACTASVRSIRGYQVTQALERCGDLLTSFGGHAMAAGCSFPTASFDALRGRLQSDAAERIDPLDLTPQLTADLCVAPEHLSLELCEGLASLEPFGQGNAEPSFVLTDVILRGARRVGRDATHLQAFVQEKKLIGFHLGHLAEVADQPLDILCRVGIDTWQGTRNAQLFLDDARVADEKYQGASIKDQKTANIQ